MKNKLNTTLLLMLVFLLVPFVSSAQESLGTFAQGEDIRVVQLCGTCSFNNITSITYPNSSTIVTNVEMTKDGTEYYYILSGNFTKILGTYNVNGFGDPSGTNTAWAYDFEISPTGEVVNGWKVTIQIFASLSTLFLMGLFLYLANGSNAKIGPKGLVESEELNVLRFFFIGLALIFLVAHIIITSSIIFNTIGEGYLSNSYTYVMYAFFTIIILMFLYIITKISFLEVNKLQIRKGLR